MKNFLIFFIIFFNYLGDQINFVKAINFPINYNIVSTDNQVDGINNTIIQSDQLDMTHLYAINNKGVNGYPVGFYMKIKVDNILRINKGNRYEFYLNPNNNANLFYKAVLFAASSSAPEINGVYTISFWKSIDQEVNWNKLAEYTDINAENYNLVDNSLGYNIESDPNSYIEIRVSESLFDQTATVWNIYAKTIFGSAYINADRNPNSSSLLYNLEYNDFITSWPGIGVYKNLSENNPDPIADQQEIPKEQQEIYNGYLTDTYHNIFVKTKFHTIPSSPSVGMNTKVYLNSTDEKYANIWYILEAEYIGSSKWDLWLRHSVDNKNTWTVLEGYSGVSLTNGEYDSGTLGLKIIVGSPGYIELYTKKTYIEEPIYFLNLYYETAYGLEGETVDRSPDFGSNSKDLTKPINQIVIDPPNLAPAEVDQGEVDVTMTMLMASTTVGTVEWTSLRIDKTSSSTMQDIDVDGIKIWKDDGDQIFETNQDMMVAYGQNPFSSGIANIILNPTQILTTINSYYFITYNINWFSGIDRTVGMYIGDKTYFTISSPDNVSTEYFPFIAGNSKIIPAAYLSFNILGIDNNVNIEGATTTVATGGSGWINFGSLTPNFTNVAAQELEVTTNTETGYWVTVSEDQNLTNIKTNETISDVQGTNAAPAIWSVGSGFGYHTSDSSLKTGTVDRFLTDDTYAAITNNSEEVAYHSGATTGQTTTMIYKLKTDAIQSTGQYSNIVNYICTAAY